MMVHGLFIYLISSAILFGSGSKQDDAIPTLGVCQALSHALEYNGKIVRIQGPVVGSDEGAGFFDNSCPGIFVTGDKTWHSAIAWTMPTATRCPEGSVGTCILHPVEFQFDWESRKKLDKRWRKLLEVLPEECVAVTYTGMFETRTDWPGAKVKYPNGTEETVGFGHLGMAPAQLVLKSADDVQSIPNCKVQK